MRDAFFHTAMQLQREIRRTEWQTLPAQAQNFFSQKGNEVQEIVYEIKLENLPEIVKQYIKDHPYQTAFLIIGCFVYLCPSSMTAPLLRMFGFTPLGPQTSKYINLSSFLRRSENSRRD
jgi:hypothetical protein